MRLSNKTLGIHTEQLLLLENDLLKANERIETQVKTLVHIL